MISILFFLFSSFLSFNIVSLIIPFLNRFFLDLPNKRSSHSSATPRGAGIAFVLVSCLICIIAIIFRDFLPPGSFSLSLAPLVALPLASAGFLDDRYNLPSAFRFSVQVLTVLLVFMITPLATFSLSLPAIFFLLLIATSIINFTNFMDGVDGLVAGCMIILLSVSAIQLSSSWLSWAFVGSLFGFLLWNWSPAKVFMGDVGSTFLPVLFIAHILNYSSWLDAFSLLLVATPLLGDSFFCLIRRLFALHPIFKAHRLHLFQRLHQSGWSHGQVSGLYVFATLVLALAHLFSNFTVVFVLAVSELFVGLWLDQHQAVSFRHASQDYLN